MTVPLPIPCVPVVIVIHGVVVAAVQKHPAPVVTVIVRVPPKWSSVGVVALTVLGTGREFNTLVAAGRLCPRLPRHANGQAD